MLNTEQQSAVDSTSQNILVLAGAGSGKSTVLLSRISRLIGEGVSPSGILALTFTNAAALEMRKRYSKSHPNAILPTFCTFHGFCYSLIIRDAEIRHQMGYNNIPTMADTTTIKKLETMCKQQCGTKLSQDKLNGKEPLSPKDKFQYDIYWKQYNKLLRQQNLITFDIMCYEVCELFVNNNPIVDKYKKQYIHIFVDEFQDTDDKQWSFVKSFEKSNKFVVGDAKQNLYKFRGSDSSIIKSLTKKSDWQTIKMGHNYRSTNQICDYANEIHRYWINSPYNLSIHSDVDGAEVVENSEFHCFGELGKECVRSIVKSIIPNKSMAILCRTNAEVADVKKLLKQNNILFCSNSSTLENIEDILKSAMDDEYMIDWLSSQLNQTDYINFVKMSTIDDSYLSGERFISEYREKLNADLLNQIFSVRKILASEQVLYQKGVDITNLLKLPKKPINLALNTIEDLIKYILDLIDELDIDTNIYVGTIHSVKGLEYDIVHVIGVDGDSFKLNCEDMYNLFYVACTRAKEQLYIWKS